MRVASSRGGRRIKSVGPLTGPGAGAFSGGVDSGSGGLRILGTEEAAAGRHRMMRRWAVVGVVLLLGGMMTTASAKKKKKTA